TFNTLSVTTYHPVGWGLHKIRKKFKNSSPPPFETDGLARHLPVLFVHGILHNATAFFAFEKKLHSRGFAQLETIEFWTSLQGIAELASRLKTAVKNCVQKNAPFDGPSVRIVAHSLGGMIVRVALLDAEFAKHISKIIFLGTPHQGSRYY